MRLAEFIEANSNAIVAEAVVFSRTLLPAAGHLDEAALRDHLPMILAAIVNDLRTDQSDEQELRKSQGRMPLADASKTVAAQSHALLRAKAGFNIMQMVSEYRSLRASVLREWLRSPEAREETAIRDIVRFNEAVDQAVAESVSHFTVEAERWRNVFLAVLGHDLRGPLNAVLLTAEVLSTLGADARTSAVAERLVKSGQRMRELLDSLLDYSRSSLGQGIVIYKQSGDLAAQCAEELETLRESLPGRDISLSVTGDTSGMFDGSRVREALSNLVTNAANYGAPDTPVRVALTGSENGVRLSVENEGPTIPVDVLPALFEPLRRGGMAAIDVSSSRTNLGLGLFIVQAVSAAHGGTVAATSGSGKTRFEVVLPRS
jgi:signal transduction histidine kinase